MVLVVKTATATAEPQFLCNLALVATFGLFQGLPQKIIFFEKNSVNYEKHSFFNGVLSYVYVGILDLKFFLLPFCVMPGCLGGLSSHAHTQGTLSRNNQQVNFSLFFYFLHHSVLPGW